MKILSKNDVKKLTLILEANQIILNAFDSLSGFDKFDAYGKFCDNTSEALFILGGEKLVNEAKNTIFVGDINE